MGTVTFLFTDIEGSTSLWEEHASEMQTALARHDEILRSVLEGFGGYVFSTAGDAFSAAFARAGEAVAAAVAAQVALGVEPWPEAASLRVRIGLHTGEAQERGGDYFGPAVSRAARIMSAGHGGQVLVSGAVLEVAGETAGSWGSVDLGTHRLRGIRRPVKIHELVFDGRPVDGFPALRVETARVGNLEAGDRSFVGRDVEIRDLEERLSSSRLVTLVGAGGIGKTTLATHVADALRSRFPDGVWMCELAAIESPDAVVGAVATTLAVRRQRGLSVMDSVVGAFKDADALMVIDNCEHVIDEAARVVGELARGCGRLVIVATSREPLGLASEHVMQVSPLSVPGEESDEERVEGSPAFQLFVDRAGEAGATLRDGPESTSAIAEICRRLDGLPLAIELAAARTRSMSLVEISRRLDERFRLLAGHQRDAPARLRTLWDAVDWSYQLLDTDDRELFDVLSVFMGGFTIAAAAAVADNDPDVVEDQVWSLVDRSLVAVVDSTDATRYLLLETLRQYGSERLRERGDLDTIRSTHLRYFARLAGEADQLMRGRDEAAAVTVITSELANLRAAHQHALASADTDRAGELVASLHDYAIWRQFFELGSWAEATLALPTEGMTVEPLLHATAGWGRCIAGDFETALSHAERGLSAEAADGDSCGWLHDVLAHCAFFQDDDPGGLVHGQAEIDRARGFDDPYRLGYVLADHATHTSLSGDVELARQEAYEALALAERSGSPAVISMAYVAQAFSHLDDDPIQAMEWLRRAADLADTVDSSWTSGICRGELAGLLSVHGDPSEALDLALRQFTMFRRAGDAARARDVIRVAIPVLHRLTDRRRWPDIVILDAGTSDRPQVRQPHHEQRVETTINEIRHHLGDDVTASAALTGSTLDDDEVFGLAYELMLEISTQSG
jgi:predicted ATPase/class 3 adenylate cyclase